ncbi:signal peptidase I [Actinosynnema pretiosum]|uniref:Signal peptidase I n=1 Tax=Actinosynnema pretiosum TaxID=42197 RepID=A0A290Z9Q5_9PSEU|nr:signal peptidase I [Actinosynnema pretiosum]ATE55738.1 signal peptidase I [Actinosynnema pretiosum]
MGDAVSNWQAGNVTEDASDTRGWLVGHFIAPAQGVRSQKDVEVKWFHHPAGDKRAEWTSDDQRTTLVFLISGNFRVDLTEGGKTMTEQGDYIMWGPGIDHSWEALADSVVMTVRWPSQT